jgi:O-antigen/teichoic acid export membrane protein
VISERDVHGGTGTAEVHGSASQPALPAVHGQTRRDLTVGFASQLAYKALGFVVLALLARTLTSDDFGRLMFSLTLCGVTVLLTDLGVSTDLVRRVSASPRSARRNLSRALSVRLPLIGVYFVAVNGWVALTKPDVLPVTLGISVHVALKDLYRTYSSVFLGLRRIGWTVISFGGALALLASGVALGAMTGRSIAWMVGCYILSGAVTVGVSWGIGRARVGPAKLHFSVGVMRRELSRSLLLFALALMTLVHFSADTILMGYMRPYADVATYEAAAKLLEASQFFVRPITMTLFPVCAALAARSRWGELSGMLDRMFLSVCAVGLCAAAGVALLADPIVRVVYTDAYGEAARVLRVLYLSVPGLYAATVGTFVAASVHREARAVAVFAAGVLLNVVVNLWAIPRYGPIGAAWVTVATQTLTAAWLGVEAYRAVAGRRLATPKLEAA